MHTLASGPRLRSDAKPAFACPAYALPTAMGYRQASDGSLVKIGLPTGPPDDEAPTGAEAEDEDKDEDEAEPRPTATAMRRGAAEGDFLIEIFPPPEKRAKRVSQTWKCIEDVKNSWLKAAFHNMYVPEDLPSPDCPDSEEVRVLKKAAFKMTLEVEEEWVHPVGTPSASE